MKVLVISGYDAASHKRWRQGLERALPEFEFTHIALPARYFSWRIRGNSLSLATLFKETLCRDYDCVLATSMVDLSSLRGMLPSLASLPTLLYFHENQFQYPASAQQTHSIEPQIVTLYGAVCADRLVFNSEFNRTSFLAGVNDLLAKMPDLVPKALAAELAAKSQVVAVPLEAEVFYPRITIEGNERLEFIWNHRWEYDKNPGLLLAALERLKTYFNGQLPFTVHVVGQSFRKKPPAFDAIKTLLTECDALGQWGYRESLDDYRALLKRCDAVISTADHDFQGLSVLEAVAAGCTPIVPRHQVYPEFFGEHSCYHVTGDASLDAQSLTNAVLSLLTRHAESGAVPSAPDVSSFSWQTLAPVYQSLLVELATHRG